METGRNHQPALLGPREPPPYAVANAGGASPMVLTCDHASHAVPACLADLGLEPDELRRHTGWDPGARDLALLMGERFDATVVLSGYSRLVIDCNRAPGSETSIPKISDGTRIPGNQAITPAEAARREAALFHPYHEAVAGALDAVRDRGEEPTFVAIHSFTPCLAGGFPRPWHFGVLWDEDPRVAGPLIEALRSNEGLVVGDNEPYSGRDHFDFSQGFHATAAGLASALVEVRADLLETDADLAHRAAVLGDALETALREAGAYCEVG